jgi:hypothetical protein
MDSKGAICLTIGRLAIAWVCARVCASRRTAVMRKSSSGDWGVVSIREHWVS